MYCLLLVMIGLLRRASGAPSYGNAEINEFRRSSLFKITGRLIGMFIVYGGTGEDGRGPIL